MGILRTDKLSGLETPTAVPNSVLFDGNDYLSIAEVPELKLGTTDFTIEAWINFGNDPGDNEHQNIIAAGNPESANSFVIQIRSDNSSPPRLLDFRTDTRSDLSKSSIPLNEWTHIAVTKESNVVKLFVNGVLENSATEAEDLTTAITAIGYRSASSYGYVNGYISNLRILKGTALYTSDFTVPAHALEVIEDTVLLCCNNPDSVTASDHGKIGAAPPTLTANGDPAVSSINPGLTRDFTYGTEFRGVTTFDTQGYFVPPSGTTEQRGRGRGLFGGGETPTSPNTTNIIDYIQIQTQGNAVDFGDLTQARRKLTSFSSSTRGIFGDGATPGATDIIDYVTIATTGNALDFGDTTQDCVQSGGCSNQVRGLFGGGYNTPPTVTGLIQYVTIATKGDTISFGDLTQERFDVAGCASPTRGIFGGGKKSPTSENFDIIDYVTIMSTGNAVDFGNLTVGRRNPVSCSSTVRGLFAGGFATPLLKNEIDYITIASTGNAQDFGDLTVAKQEMNAGLSDNVRGVFGGGQVPSAPIRLNSIDYVTIASTGNAQDFGDLTGERNSSGSASDSHGGIS